MFPLHPLLLLAGLLLVLPARAQIAPLPAEPSSGEPAEFAGMLAGHNRLRTGLGLPPLRWSAAAQAQAQGWANQLARENCALRYNPDDARRERYGENLYKAYSGQPYEGYRRTVADVLQRWEDEGRHYDHQRHVCSATSGPRCAQYLQMIWETTTDLGCGRARCATGEVWVCNYTPRGGQEGLKPYGNPPPPPPEAAECPLPPRAYEGPEFVNWP